MYRGLLPTTFTHYSARFLIVLSTFLIVSCGGGGGGSNGGSSNNSTLPSVARTISGTAATGAAIDGFVEVIDRFGNMLSTRIDSNGEYFLDVRNLTPPLLVIAKPIDPTQPAQYSYTSLFDVTVNVTPMTSLALYTGSGGRNFQDLENSWTTLWNRVPASSVWRAGAVVAANFSSQFGSAGLQFFDIFNSPFTVGDAYDSILDGISISVDSGAGIVSVSVDSDPLFSFDPNISTWHDAVGCPGAGNAIGVLSLCGPGVTVLDIQTFNPTEFRVSRDYELDNFILTYRDQLIWSFDSNGYSYSLNLGLDYAQFTNRPLGVSSISLNSRPTTGWFSHRRESETYLVNVNVGTQTVRFDNVVIFGGSGDSSISLGGALILNGTLRLSNFSYPPQN